ncbi:MAG: DUF4416 family protein [Candidatus Krumholzibacteriota bacterium]|nr:DUF4416 family protein [Candidatus Krumholzibacteriota bacterium]
MAHQRAGRPRAGAPVKIITAVLFGPGFPLQEGLLPRLERLLGKSDYQGAIFPFDKTDYYQEEMGSALSRTIFSFSPLVPAPDIAAIKLSTAEIEAKFEGEGGRRVNIDPGYIDFFKVVLSSFKEGPQKIYLGQGVYADPQLMFQHGTWEPLPWSFPDFKAGFYDGDLTRIRNIYKKEIRSV